MKRVCFPLLVAGLLAGFILGFLLGVPAGQSFAIKKNETALDKWMKNEATRLDQLRRRLDVTVNMLERRLQGSALVGIASWYGDYFHGRTAADGSTYDMYAMTAAHKELPLGSWVLVQRLDRPMVSALVQITDRGPYIDPRMIDLSLGAADALDMIKEGICLVRITRMK